MSRSSSKYFWLFSPSTGTSENKTNALQFTSAVRLLQKAALVLTDAEENQGLHAQELFLRDLQQHKLLRHVSHPYAVLVHGGKLHSMSAGIKRSRWETQNTENTKSWEAKAKSLYTLDICTEMERRQMSEVRTKFIDVIKEAEAADYLYNESGDSSVIFDALDETLEKPNSLFPRKEFLFDCLWISIVMLAPFEVISSYLIRSFLSLIQSYFNNHRGGRSLTPASRGRRRCLLFHLVQSKVLQSCTLG